MAKYLADELELQSIANAIRTKSNTLNNLTFPNGFVNAITNISSGGNIEEGGNGNLTFSSDGDVVGKVSLNATANGTYTPPTGKAYSSVTVNVSGGDILSGTSAPTAAIGNNEDLYIQYSGHPEWNYLYGIDTVYRKINGSWIEYTDPIDPNSAIHVWTQSTGGTDAAMNVQKAIYDPDTGVYTPVGDIDIVLYKTVTDNTYNLDKFATLSYGRAEMITWSINASVQITDGSQTYATGDLVASWQYTANQDIYLRYVI